MRHSPTFGLVLVTNYAIQAHTVHSVLNVIGRTVSPIEPTFDLLQLSVFEMKGEAYAHV